MEETALNRDGGGGHSVGSSPYSLDKGLPVRTWRLRGLYAKIRGPYQDKYDRVGLCAVETHALYLKRSKSLSPAHTAATSWATS